MRAEAWVRGDGRTADRAVIEETLTDVFGLHGDELFTLLDLHANCARAASSSGNGGGAAAAEPPRPPQRPGRAEPGPAESPRQVFDSEHLSRRRSVQTDARVPPQNPEAEESVLGAMMLSPAAIDAVRGEVAAGDFYRESHGRIYTAALDLRDRGGPVDAITLVDELEERGQLDDVGGRVRINELAALVPATGNAAHYARIVREKATLRALIRAGGEIARLGWEQPDDTPVLLDRALTMVETAARTASGTVARQVTIVPFAEFAAVVEESARPLLGSQQENVLPADGFKLVFGEAGVGKTSLALDAALHLAAGVEWLGLDVPAPVTTLLVEAEGPRGPWRRKLSDKAATWEGPAFRDRIHVLEEPWAAVSFADPTLRRALATVIVEHGIELVIAGPLSRLGMEGGGTLAEVAAFEHHLTALRALVDRPLAFWLVHHENKAGEVSGAWERAPDTLVHVKRDGRERSIVRWTKCRWAPALHGGRWTLAWRPGERYEIVDQDGPEGAQRRDAEEQAALTWIVQHVDRHFTATGEGIPRNALVKAYQDAHDGKGRNVARRVIEAQIDLYNRVLGGEGTGEDSPALATGPGEVKNGIYLYPASHAPLPLATGLAGEGGEQESDPRQEAQPRHLAARPKGGEGRAASGGGDQDQAEVERLADLAREAGA